MLKKYLVSLLCLTFAITAFTACGVKLSETSLYVHEDGSIEAAVYEAFDSNTYDEAALKSFLEEAVISYNQTAANVSAAYKKDAKEGIPVAIDSVKVKSEEAILKMTYASSEDYLTFNAGDDSIMELITGTVGQQSALGCNLGEYTLLDAEGESFVGELSDDAHFLVAQGDKKILVEGKILCVSKGVAVEDKKTAVITPEAGSCLIVFSK